MKKFLSFTLKIAVSFTLVWIVLSKIGFQNLLSEVGSASPRFLLLALLFFLLSITLGALQWDLLLKAQRIRIPLKKVISFYFVGVFFNNFLPTNIGGDVIRVYDVRRVSGEGSAAFAATFLDRFVGLFSLTCFALVAYSFCPNLRGSPSVLLPILLAALAMAAVLTVGFSRRLGGIVERVGLSLVPQRIGTKLARVREGVVFYRSKWKLLGGVFLISLGVQILRVAVHYTVGLSLGVEVGFRYFLVFVPLIAIAAGVPISFGGIGVRENLGVLLFHDLLGVQAAAAFSMQFLAYLVGITASSAGGLIFIFRRAQKPTDEVSLEVVKTPG